MTQNKNECHDKQAIIQDRLHELQQNKSLKHHHKSLKRMFFRFLINVERERDIPRALSEHS